jgi:hypothetical protein
MGKDPLNRSSSVKYLVLWFLFFLLERRSFIEGGSSFLFICICSQAREHEKKWREMLVQIDRESTTLLRNSLFSQEKRKKHKNFLRFKAYMNHATRSSFCSLEMLSHPLRCQLTALRLPCRVGIGVWPPAPEEVKGICKRFIVKCREERTNKAYEQSRRYDNGCGCVVKGAGSVTAMFSR